MNAGVSNGVWGTICYDLGRKGWTRKADKYEGNKNAGSTHLVCDEGVRT